MVRQPDMEHSKPSVRSPSYRRKKPHNETPSCEAFHARLPLAEIQIPAESVSVEAVGQPQPTPMAPLHHDRCGNFLEQDELAAAHVAPVGLQQEWPSVAG